MSDTERLTYDECGNIWSVTGSPGISHDIYKFNMSSIAFSDKKDYIECNNIQLGGNDFTIEMWVYATYLKNWTVFFSITGLSGSSRLYLECNDNVLSTSLQYNSDISTNVTMNLNTWYFVTAVYKHSESKLKTYINGILRNELSVTFSSSNPLIRLGNSQHELDNSMGLCGYIDEFRLSNIARYNSNFSVPSESLSKDSNTISLLKF